MASRLLLLFAVIIALCSGAIHRKHDALIKRENSHRYPQKENRYNKDRFQSQHRIKHHAAKQMSEYDQMLQQEEAQDLLSDWNNDNDYQQNEFQAYNNYDNEFNSYNNYNQFDDYFDGDSDTDTDGDEEESEEGDETYSEKEQLTAFLLSFFLGGLGAGRFYVGDYALGSVKLCLICITCCVGMIAGWIAMATGNEQLNDATVEEADNFCERMMQKMTGKLGLPACIGGCGCCAWYLWVIVDWFMFGLNKIPDADGKTLYPM